MHNDPTHLISTISYTAHTIHMINKKIEGLGINTLYVWNQKINHIMII